MLEQALARGQLRCMGATTLGEYRKYIEKDPALARRFQEVCPPVFARVHTSVCVCVLALACARVPAVRMHGCEGARVCVRERDCGRLWRFGSAKVLVQEPTVPDTISILRGIKAKYEVGLPSLAFITPPSSPAFEFLACRLRVGAVEGLGGLFGERREVGA